MASAFVTAAFGAGCASMGSLVTGFALKAAERRGTLRDAGRLEIERKRAVQAYEATHELTHHVTELIHCVHHVVEADSRTELEEYTESGQKHRLSMRQLAREHEDTFGSDLVTEVVLATDKVAELFAAAWNEEPAEVLEGRMRAWQRDANVVMERARRTRDALLT